MSEDDSLQALREAEDGLVKDELLAVGIQNDGAYSLLRMKLPPPAIPVLLSLMRRVTHPSIKQGVIRALATKSAVGIAGYPLIEYFEELSEPDWGWEDTKWVIGNTLEAIADDAIANRLVEIALEKRHGRSREMIVLALGRLRSKGASEALIALSSDPDVCGHAIAALGKSGDRSAIPVVREKLEDEKAWVRMEARKALKKLQAPPARRAGSK